MPESCFELRDQKWLYLAAVPLVPWRLSVIHLAFFSASPGLFIGRLTNIVYNLLRFQYAAPFGETCILISDNAIEQERFLKCGISGIPESEPKGQGRWGQAVQVQAPVLSSFKILIIGLIKFFCFLKIWPQNIIYSAKFFCLEALPWGKCLIHLTLALPHLVGRRLFGACHS